MARWDTFLRFLDEIQQTPDHSECQMMVDTLLREHEVWPWIEGHTATFVFSRFGAERVALNMDIIERDPPFEPLTRVEGTTLWYLQRGFSADDLLDYVFVVDDPMTPLNGDPDILGRIARYWEADPRNPQRMSTAQMDVSILRMPAGRPVPNWRAMPNVPRGQIYEHVFDSAQMGFTGRKLWVYTPPGYDGDDAREYPLLVLFDGQWMIGPMQAAYIADALIKHGQMEPVIIAMKQSAQENRARDYISNDRHYTAILTEVLPLLQTLYRIDGTNLGLGGVGEGAIAAAHSALRNPAVFSHLMMLSPPLGKGPGEEALAAYADRFASAPMLPRRIFQSVGRYESRSRFYRPGRDLAGVLGGRMAARGDIDYRFVELGSGHGLVAFKSLLPEALAHVFPPAGG
jgi:enterochelin esterase-like enzyme